MVYIIAPYSLKVNTTSRNRILSFYRACVNHDIPVTIISPPTLFNLAKWYNQAPQVIEDINVIYLPELNRSPIAAVSKPFLKRFRGLFKLLKNSVAPALVNYTFQKYTNTVDLNRVLSLTEEDTILCSFPSMISLHLTKALIKKSRCKLITDYRDPWTYGYDLADVPTSISRLRKIFERANERYFINTSSAITVISDKLKEYFPTETQKKIRIVRNGANLSDINCDLIEDRPDKLRLVYLGHVYDDQLKDKVFFQALKQFVSNYNLNYRDFEVVFLGANNSYLKHIITEYELEDVTRIYPTLDISEAMKIAYTASAFFHLRYGRANSIETSKHADYIALQKPIILPISDGGILAENTLAYEGGYVCNNEQEFCQLMKDLLEDIKKGKGFRVRRDGDFLYSISREAEAEKLVELIKEIA